MRSVLTWYGWVSESERRRTFVRDAPEASRGTTRRCRGSPASHNNYFDLHTHLANAIDYNSRDLTSHLCLT